MRGCALNIKHQFEAVQITYVGVTSRAVPQAWASTHDLQIASGAGELGRAQKQSNNGDTDKNMWIFVHRNLPLKDALATITDHVS
jgi:hypothetical protein